MLHVQARDAPESVQVAFGSHPPLSTAQETAMPASASLVGGAIASMRTREVSSEARGIGLAAPLSASAKLAAGTSVKPSKTLQPVASAAESTATLRR